MTGVDQADSAAKKVLESIYDQCHDSVSPTNPDGKKKSCTKLGCG